MLCSFIPLVHIKIAISFLVNILQSRLHTEHENGYHDILFEYFVSQWFVKVCLSYYDSHY